MEIQLFETLAINPAMAVLPTRMDSKAARRMLIAIAIQESNLEHRRQSPRGPARGWWQFEIGGVEGVLRHAATSVHCAEAMTALHYSYPVAHTYPHKCKAILEHCDALAGVFARLNLWWLPQRLPFKNEMGNAWRQYLEAWRPGKPRPQHWPRSWGMAKEYIG